MDFLGYKLNLPTFDKSNQCYYKSILPPEVLHASWPSNPYLHFQSILLLSLDSWKVLTPELAHYSDLLHMGSCDLI